MVEHLPQCLYLSQEDGKLFVLGEALVLRGGLAVPLRADRLRPSLRERQDPLAGTRGLAADSRRLRLPLLQRIFGKPFAGGDHGLEHLPGRRLRQDDLVNPHTFHVDTVARLLES